MTSRINFWPRNLTGRTILLLLGSLTTFHVGSLWMHSHAAPTGRMSPTDALASTTVMVIGILAVSVLLVRWLTGPLRRLAEAADRIGRGKAVALPQDGPGEVVRLARALDAMQSRITRLIDDRTHALAAVSHDLRTPITRMRLRAGFIDDPAMQARMEADLDEMEGMISATLAYLQGQGEGEPEQLTDVGALLSTLCDAAVDAGQSVTFEGFLHLDVLCKPISLRRAVSNLISNAVSYGGSAICTLSLFGSEVMIAVVDQGPGISNDELARVFEPFYRPDASRNRSTGGVGLGLTIAQQGVIEQGGTLTLTNIPAGGLRAEIRFPRGNWVRPSGSDLIRQEHQEVHHAST
jgi:signal transduction histidine kinase